MSSSVMSERFENVADDASSRKERKFFSSFVEKRNQEATCVLVRTRSDHAKPLKKKKTIESVWDQKPVDLTWKLFHPRPPKRNTREAIKPWEYDKYLRKTEENELSAKSREQPADKTSLMSNLFKPSATDETDQNDTSDNAEFKVDVRVDTPDRARFKAAREMGFREGLDTYRIPKPHDFRGVSRLFGLLLKFTTGLAHHTNLF